MRLHGLKNIICINSHKLSNNNNNESSWQILNLMLTAVLIGFTKCNEQCDNQCWQSNWQTWSMVTSHFISHGYLSDKY